MLHFIGMASLGRALPETSFVESAARRLGGPGFSPLASWRGESCVLAYRRFPLRAATETAPAPVLARNGDLVLIGSGRIDEQEQLASTLGLLGRPDLSDTELMAAAFERWGADAANRLRGDFSFAVWERKAKRLTLARDPFGRVPLFYHHGDGFVAFGVNPAALLALGLPRDLDQAMLGEGITGRAPDPEATVYLALKRVRRASTLVIDPNGARTQIYWRAQRGPMLRLKDDQAYVEATRETLATVMRGHLRTTKPIGVMLSGGFDSGAVAATLAMLTPEREIFGFTTVPVAGDKAYQRGMGREWAHVEALARMHPNLRIDAVSEKPLTPLDDSLRELFADIGTPIAGPALMTRRLALAAAAQKRGVGTLLSGDGGNHTLSAEGDWIYRELFRDGRWLTLAREILGAAQYQGAPVLRVLWRQALRDSIPRSWLRAWSKMRGISSASISQHTFLRPDFAKSSGLDARWRSRPHNLQEWLTQHLADQSVSIFEAQRAVAESVTLAYNRLGMENAAPLRDRRMVDFMLSLPADQLQRNGVPRFLARRALADRMPAETLAEPGVFESFADVEQWLAGWWDRAEKRIAAQTPVELAEAAIDFPALRAALAEGPPKSLPRSGREADLIGSALGNAVYINEFIRWHAGKND